MTKTDSYANQCVKTEENMNKMTTSEIVAEADAQFTDGYQSATCNDSLMESHCVDSEKTFDKSMKRLSSVNPLSLSQKILLDAEENRNRSVNWRHRYSQELPSVGGVTATPPWNQNVNVVKSKITATSTSTGLNPRTFGKKSINVHQSATTSGTDSQMEFHRFDRFDLKTTTDEFIGQEFSPTLTQKMLMQAEAINKLTYKRSTKSEKRSQKSPYLQMHYSQAVPSLNGPFTASFFQWGEVLDPPQPSSKQFHSVQLNGSCAGASRKDLYSLPLQGWQPTTTQLESYEYLQSNEEVITSVDAFYVAEGRQAPTVSKPAISGNESTDTNRDAEIIKSTPVVEPQAQMQSLKSVEAGQLLLPQNLQDCDRLNMNTPALMDHTYYKPIESTNAARPAYSPVKFTNHPPTSIANGSTEPTNTLPPASPKEFDRTTQSYAMNERVTSVPAVSEYFHREPIDYENTAKSQVSPVTLISSTTSTGNESVWPPESWKEYDRSNIGIPATTQAQAPWDYSHYEAENTATQPPSPVNLMHPTTNPANESIGQTNILPSPSPEEFDRSNISLPAATQSETPISVPTQSDYSYNKPIDVKESAITQVSPTASVMPPGAALSLNQQNFVQTPKNAITPTTTTVNSSAKTQKRPYRRRNKIVVQSDESINMPTPPVGSIIQTLPNSAVRINSNQIIFGQKPSNVQKNAKPIHANNIKNLVQNQAKSNPPATTTATSLKRKNTENIPAHVPSKAKFPMKNEPKPNPTAIIATSLKRKNKENLSLHDPAKVQKMEQSIQVTRTNMATSSISVNLPDITIERIDMAPEANKSATMTSLKNRSFSDCVKFLERNNVTVFKVPRNPQPFKGTQNLQQSNKVFDKYVKVLQQNGIRVERVSKNINRV